MPIALILALAMPNHYSFLTRLKRASKLVKEIPAAESRTIALHANYGSYRLRIGPEYPPRECRDRQLPLHSRSIEIEGEIDHLILEGEACKPMPDRAEIDRQLQGTVIIHGVAVHIYDADGEGDRVQRDAGPMPDIRIAEAINLAGPAGEELLATWRATGRLTEAAYRVIQQDIVRALRRNEEISIA